MAYSKQNWTDGAAGATPLSAARLNTIENGIAVATKDIGTTAGTVAAGNDSRFGAAGSGSSVAVNASDYGFLTTATAAANDTAIAAAIATGRPVYVSGKGESNPYHISVPIDLRGGTETFYGDYRNTHIRQDTDTATIMQIGGMRNEIKNLLLTHGNPPSSTQGNGIEITNLFLSHLSNIDIENTKIALHQVSGAFFSNQIDCLAINGYYTSGINITLAGNTGSAWNNIYVNNQVAGASLTCYGAPVNITNMNDTVFNQLNIEHVNVNTGSALNTNANHSMVVNGLHIEGVSLMAYGTSYVLAYGVTTKLLVNGLNFEFSDLAPTGASGGGRNLLRAAAGGKLTVTNIHCEGNTNTGAQVGVIASTEVGNNARVRINGGITPDILTADNTSNVFLLDSIPSSSQTGIGYTLILDDLGKMVEMQNAAANTLTVPADSAAAFPVGAIIQVTQSAAGQTTVAAAAGVTLRTPQGARLASQYATASLRKRAANEWVLSGGLIT